jgi:hypothetical protein
LALCLTALCASASAETHVEYAGVVRGKYMYNTDDEVDASVSDTRVELDIGVGDLTIGTVYRAYLLSDEAYNPADVVSDPVEIKHRYASLLHDDLLIRAGHFFSTFGHGLTLRSYEDVDLEYDTAMDGLLLEYSVGEFDVTALTGTATDYPGGTSYVEHVIRGARAAMPMTEWAEIAGSIVERSRTLGDEEEDLPEELARFEDTLVGSELSVWAGPVTLAAEYAGRDGGNPVTGESQIRGHATYASATLDLPFGALFGEYKHYQDYSHYLVNPPTAVRDHLWTMMNRATYQIDLDDEHGFLVEGSAPLGETFYALGGASEARNHDGDLRHWELFAQLDWVLGSGATGSLAASRSREYLFAGGEAAGKFTERTIGGASLEFMLPRDQAIEATLEGQTTDDPDGKSYEDYILSVAYYPGLDLTLIATAERTTLETADRDSWFMAEIRKLLSDDFEVSLSAGTERGGKKCTGGVCFVEPAFEGARLRFTRFF